MTYRRFSFQREQCGSIFSGGQGWTFPYKFKAPMIMFTNLDHLRHYYAMVRLSLPSHLRI
uniref:Uncharacterized protein n=1 Tax=Anguilla anguilla TaxID=7936 RepID=A0A0E9TWJ3_ANGAN